MPPQDRSRAVLITGASSGIGEACALHLDAAGYHVFAGVRGDSDGDSLNRKGSDRLTPIILDVTDAESIARAASEVAGLVGEGGLLGLVNNAGIPLGGPLEFLPLADLRRQIEVNVIGAVAVTQAFLPLIRAGKGRIVNMSSLSGLIALPFVGPYASTKHALEAISDSLRVELRPWNIPVCVVEPGDVATLIWEKSAALIEEGARAMPPRGQELYGPVIALRERLKWHGMPVERVAEVVEHALTARHPSARYLVGRDARLLAFVGRLPVRIRDWIIATQLPKYP